MKKSARLLLLGVGLAAFGGAFMLMNRSQPEQPVIVQANKPQAKMEFAEVLVASKPIGLGSLLSSIDVRWAKWPTQNLSEGMITKQMRPKALEEVDGAVARQAFYSGEPIRPEKIVKGPNSGFLSAILPSGSRAVAINIDASGATSAGGFILPNDRVDIVRTARAGKNFGAETIMRNVRVLAIGKRVEEKNGERVVVGTNATLELSPRQAERIILAQRTGQLALVLRSMLDADATKKDPQEEEVAAPGITLVRFGVASQIGAR